MSDDAQDIAGDVDSDEFDTIPPPARALERLRLYAAPITAAVFIVGGLSIVTLNAVGAIGTEPEPVEPEPFRASLGEREPPDLSRPEPIVEPEPIYHEPQTVVVSERVPAEASELAYPNEPAPAPAPPPPPPPRPARGVQPMMVASSTGAQEVSAPPADIDGERQASVLSALDTDERTDAGAPAGAVRVARRLARRDMLVLGGTTVPCVLDRSLMTATAGPASCHTIRDVLSADFSRVMIPRGSRMTGDHAAGTLGGADVVGVVMTRIVAGGVVVDIGPGPVVGALGGVGVEARVERHFWRRFGGAAAVAVIGDISSAAVANAGRSGGTDVTVGAANGAANTVVEEIVRQTVGMPSTGSANRGAMIGVYLRDDLDFSAAYGAAGR